MSKWAFLAEGVESPLEGLRSGLLQSVQLGLGISNTIQQNKAVQMEQDRMRRIAERQTKRQEILSSDVDSNEKVSALLSAGDIEGAQQVAGLESARVAEERAAELHPLQVQQTEKDLEAFDMNMGMKERDLQIRETANALRGIEALNGNPIMQARIIDNSPAIQKAMGIPEGMAGGGKAEDLAKRKLMADAAQKRLDKANTEIDKLEIEGAKGIFAAKGWDSGFTTFGAKFDSDEQLDRAARQVAGLAKLLSVVQPEFGDELNMERAADIVGQAVDSDGMLRPEALVEFTSNLQRQANLMSTGQVEPGRPSKAHIDKLKAIASQNNGEIPAAARQQWNQRFPNDNPDQWIVDDNSIKEQVKGITEVSKEYNKGWTRINKPSKNTVPGDLIKLGDKGLPTAQDVNKIASELNVNVNTALGKETANAVSLGKHLGSNVLPYNKRKRDNLQGAVAASESSGNHRAISESGNHYGLYQMGTEALTDSGYISKSGKWTGKDGIKSKEDYLNSPEAQTKSFNIYNNKLKNWVSKIPNIQKILGKTTDDGNKVTMSGLVMAAHLVGIGALRDAIKKGVNLRDIADNLDTSAWDYINKFSGHY